MGWGALWRGPNERGICGFVAFFYSSFLVLYRYSNRQMAPAANAQFDATVGATFGLQFWLDATGTNRSPTDKFRDNMAKPCMVTGASPLLSGGGLDSNNICASRLPGAHTSFAVLIQPVLTIIWGIFLLDESPSTSSRLG